MLFRSALPIAPNGAGDMVSSLLLGQYLQTKNWQQAVEQTMAGVHEVFAKTAATGTRELQLIAAQNAMVEPQKVYKLVELEVYSPHQITKM